MLAEPIRRWIWNQGWHELLHIQERAICALLHTDKDVIITAPTAGGKTEAAFLPLLSALLTKPGSGGFDLVYIGPLRALINDQFRRLQDLCKGIDVPVYPWHGDIAQDVKRRARNKPRGVLLITPESLEALFVLRGLEIPTLFKGTRAVVIDELHAVLDNERGMQLQSLLTRLELAIGRRLRRVGLSATLGDMSLVCSYLRPDHPESVELIGVKDGDGTELKVQIRGYIAGSRADSKDDQDSTGTATQRAVATHLFSRLRGKQNLIFAGSRQNVELFADLLRQISQRERVPLEFLPHHANLSREHRHDIEKRLKSAAPTTAVCTSTLELGIDIGKIDCVAQIGPPFSVASLRQRMGRSGRRARQPAILRMYALESASDAQSDPLDRLHLGLVRCIAMVELIVEGWCEPPSPHALHLSTLTHQILSVIAEHNGATAQSLYSRLCRKGPFRRVDSGLFSRLLRRLGSQEAALIEQAPDGSLLLGRKGERMVEHYSFYAVFQTPDEYRIIADGKALGTLPIVMVLAPEMTIVFSGRRWRIMSINDRDRVIEVTADRTGKPPMFAGGGALIHDRIAGQMRQILAGSDLPRYLDRTAVNLLEDARSEFRRLGLAHRDIVDLSEESALIATWCGTVKTSTLALLLQSRKYSAETYDCFVLAKHHDGIQSLAGDLKAIAACDNVNADAVLTGKESLTTEKFHPYLGPELLFEDARSSRLDLGAMPELALRLVDHLA